ncbi:MAG: hypothetical protein AMS16_07560 [Planctomycetes bacterium DG_58]|nr:MAG: hypothetical protein AMS16_07560 [Planctomycetes bacterium DG_58]
MAEKREPVTTCPVCGGSLTVRALSCEACESELRGRFTFPRLARLPRELQDVVEVFLRCRGNIKEVERELGISYPTVSKKLDAINLLLLSMGSKDAAKVQILRQLEAGELTVSEAVQMLRRSFTEGR